ncbi:DUF418 domain-containing protein [Gramella sp. BOM4]|nr:DUF418 domain-containing protein [Christiangramia bathymodioli]
MNSTFLNQDEFAQQWTSDIDQLAERILQLFFYTKFFPIFSLLFGLGISIQALRLKKKGIKFFSFIARRMLILFIIGICHIIFLWSGDVLNLYALLGLLVVFLIGRSNKLLIFLSAFFLLFPFYDHVFGFLFESVGFDPGSYLGAYDDAEVNRIISRGSYLEGIKLKILEYMSNIPMLFGFLAPMALSMFILGIYLGKNQIYKSLNTFIQKIGVPLIFTTVLTNLYRIVFLFYLPEFEIYSNPAFRPYFIKLMIVSDVMMGLFYLWIIGWLWYQTKWRLIFKPLQYVGGMALTNYLMQSLIGLFLFSSIGFSLYETLSPSQTFFTALAVFCLQVIYSRIWLQYFKFGTVEWLWRCLTYRKVLPILKEREAPAPKVGYGN